MRGSRCHPGRNAYRLLEAWSGWGRTGGLGRIFVVVYRCVLRGRQANYGSTGGEREDVNGERGQPFVYGTDQLRDVGA